MRKSIQELLEERGLCFSDVITDEEIVVHRMNSLKANTVEARIIIEIEIEGERFEFNDVRMFTLKKCK